LFLAVFVATALVPRAVARADPAPDPAPEATPALAAGAVDAAIDLERVTAKVETTERQLAVAQAHVVAAQAALTDATQKVQGNQAKITAVQARVKAQGVIAYEHSTSSHAAVLSVQNVGDLGAGRQYAQAALGVDDSQLATLNDAETELEHQRDDATSAETQAAADVAQLQTQHQELLDTQQHDQTQLDKWGAVSVMGDSVLTAAQLAAWYRSTGAAATLAPGTTIDDLANLYVIEGNAEHVRGDVAFAQAVVETGGFSVAAGNNYSGIGVCDSCKGGYVFPTPLDGVRAQIQLLRNYADPDSRAGNLANPPSPTLYGGDPQKAAATYNSFFLKGKAPLWNQMGNGNWATDPNYANKVVLLFAQMVTFASSHPSG
jgi:hypothetical protein